MRVGLFSDTYKPEINGVVNSVLMLKEGLEARGHEVFVFAPGNPAAEPEEHVFRTHATTLPILQERRLALPWSLKMWNTIRSLDLDIVHTHTEFGVGAFGFRARRQLGLPQVHTYHTVWEEYTHYLTRGRFFDQEARWVVADQTRRTLRNVDHVIVPSMKTLELLAGYGVTNPISVIPTGVDLDRFSPATEADEPRLAALRRRFGTAGFSHTLLIIGRIAPEKSVVELLEMTLGYLQEHPDTCVLVVGDGPSLGELVTLAANSEVSDQIFFTGEVPWETVPDFYRISDIHIGNSSTETQGLTFIEALASGTLVVSRYNRCFDGIFFDNVNASLFDRSSDYIPELKEALDPAVRQSRICAGLATARELSKPVFAQHVEEVYEQLVAT
ncbi:MAG: glycosyltransferase [Actinomycetia bacterium]|nr:glycosyltransferase [Actinomycetes bacterium]